MFSLLETRQKEQTDMLHLAAALSLQNGATIIDGGNHFNAYPVVRRVRQATADIAVVNTLQVARAFNCHQVVELIRRVPFNGAPCLVIDLLDTFEDDALTLSHRRRMVAQALETLQGINCHQAVIVSLAPPKEDIDQWHVLAAMIRTATTITFEEGFMGKTIPTISQIVQQAEKIITRFSRVVQPEEREALEELFIAARKHIAAISEANYLLPFEVVQQAMLLEQQKEILSLRQRIAELERRL